MSKKHIAILGSTGSIGTQALEVIEQYQDEFEVEVLTTRNNIDLLIKQAVRFLPNAVVVADKSKYKQVSDALSPHAIKVYAGNDAIAQIVEMDTVDIVLTAIVGYAGLRPTINAIDSGKTIALANKETLVVAGELITNLAKKRRTPILPVDSEHSAIFQCVVGEMNNPIEKIYLTASGGPFRGKDKAFLQTVTKHQALKHPNWSMGAKITIDSASLMNKGLEAIEAKWLFDLSPQQIKVIVHPQSIIHSIAQFEDGSMKAQMGLPDMKLPIQYALTFPKRLKSPAKRFDFTDYPNLSFEPPDTNVFRNLELAYQAMHIGGNMPCILNAANEAAVMAFLHDKASFLQMTDIVEKTMQKATFITTPDYEDYVKTNNEARKIAEKLIENGGYKL